MQQNVILIYGTITYLPYRYLPHKVEKQMHHHLYEFYFSSYHKRTSAERRGIKEAWEKKILFGGCRMNTDERIYVLLYGMVRYSRYRSKTGNNLKYILRTYAPIHNYILTGCFIVVLLFIQCVIHYFYKIHYYLYVHMYVSNYLSAII